MCRQTLRHKAEGWDLVECSSAVLLESVRICWDQERAGHFRVWTQNVLPRSFLKYPSSYCWLIINGWEVVTEIAMYLRNLTQIPGVVTLPRATRLHLTASFSELFSQRKQFIHGILSTACLASSVFNMGVESPPLASLGFQAICSLKNILALSLSHP